MHLSVGFTDLGVLAATLAMHEQHDTDRSDSISAPCMGSAESRSPGDSQSDKEVLRWVGVDTLPHACAKTLVLVQMLLNNAAIESTVQVRHGMPPPAIFSAAWSGKIVCRIGFSCWNCWGC